MGKLRDGINALVVLIGAFEDKTDKLGDEVSALATNVQKGLERTYGGYEVLYMYLKQKAKKEGADIKDWAKDELKSHLDTEVAKLVKGVEAARADTAASFQKQDDTVKVKVKALQADVDRAQAYVGDLNAMLAKKKKKLLQSKKYKSKLSGYEKLLSGLAIDLKSAKANADSVLANQAGSTKTLDKLKLTASTKISQIDATSWLGVRKELDGISAASGKDLGKKFKRYGIEIKQLKDWAGEAEEIEAEAQE